MKKHLATAALIVLFVAGWFVFGPAQFGGPATYVTTNGISMLQRIHAGDLVIARAVSAPKIGDVVAYHSDTLNVTVLHRIVDQTPEGFVTKGDNNSWLDPDHPTAEDIQGVEWIHIPQGGIWLRRAISPQVIGALIFALIFAGGAAATHRNRHRSRRQTMGTAPHVNHASLDAMSARREQVIKVAAASAALGGLLLVVGLTRPTHLTVTKPVETTSTTTFAYTATVPPTAAYQGTVGALPRPGVPQTREHRRRHLRLLGPARHDQRGRRAGHLQRLALERPAGRGKRRARGHRHGCAAARPQPALRPRRSRHQGLPACRWTA